MNSALTALRYHPLLTFTALALALACVLVGFFPEAM